MVYPLGIMVCLGIGPIFTELSLRPFSLLSYIIMCFSCGAILANKEKDIEFVSPINANDIVYMLVSPYGSTASVNRFLHDLYQ